MWHCVLDLLLFFCLFLFDHKKKYMATHALAFFFLFVPSLELFSGEWEEKPFNTLITETMLCGGHVGFEGVVHL